MRKQPPLYETLKIERNAIPEVWIMAEQYPYLVQRWNSQTTHPEKDLELLRLRYDADGEVQATLRAIGRQKGITAERVRRRLDRIIAWLFEYTRR